MLCVYPLGGCRRRPSYWWAECEYGSVSRLGGSLLLLQLVMQRIILTLVAWFHSALPRPVDVYDVCAGPRYVSFGELAERVNVKKYQP